MSVAFVFHCCGDTHPGADPSRLRTARETSVNCTWLALIMHEGLAVDSWFGSVSEWMETIQVCNSRYDYAQSLYCGWKWVLILTLVMECEGHLFTIQHLGFERPLGCFIQISKTWHKNVSSIKKTYITMCLYGQACYFGQVIHNSYGVSGRERMMCAMPRVFQNIHFSFISNTRACTCVWDGKLSNVCKWKTTCYKK